MSGLVSWGKNETSISSGDKCTTRRRRKQFISDYFMPATFSSNHVIHILPDPNDPNKLGDNRIPNLLLEHLIILPNHVHVEYQTFNYVIFLVPFKF